MCRDRYSSCDSLSSPWTLNGSGTWFGDNAVLDLDDGTKLIDMKENDAVALGFLTGNPLSPQVYLNFNTVTGSESIDFGDVIIDQNFNFFGSGRLTCPGRFKLPSVTDAGPMTATAGEERDLVYNESDSKVYACTVTGDPATWVALN